ncbi:hypothetical protein B566_EDAN016452 [Ephemera danica]|nr:hypothetical protein B566_EDAN016452 [Ephemera danica]
MCALEEGDEKDAETQLGVLREHLMSLGKAECHLQAAHDKALEIAPPESSQSTSVVEILQLWQQVFRETFQQYHRLSARLVRSQDGAEALRLWQEYLLHVQSFLSSSIPEDYHSLTEHQHICEVHQNLLTNQHNVLLNKTESTPEQKGTQGSDLGLAEQFSSLTNLHNETLARIMERHGQVRTRLSAWDAYRRDQAHLLAWLKDTETDKQSLQLRYIHLRQVPKVLSQIKHLLDMIPAGEEQAESLRQRQTELLEFCDETLATSIRMEHAASTQRLSNLQAGLETWRDYLLRILALHTAFEQHTTLIQTRLNAIRQIACQPCPSSHADIQDTLDSLRNQRVALGELTQPLEELGVSHEQLKECVSPGDVKMLSQRVWLLWQQHGDCEHQLALLCHHLEEKLALFRMFETRHDTETRVAHSRPHHAALLSSPTETARQLDRELEAELALKERELNWLNTTGAELLTAASDETVRSQTFSQLETQVAELRAWLYKMESQLLTPLLFESCRQEDVNNKLKHIEDIQKSIEKQSSNIGATLNLFELFLADCDTSNAAIDTDALQVAVESLERSCQEETLRDVEARAMNASGSELAELLSRVETVLEQVSARSPALQVLEHSYSQLVRESGSFENLCEVTAAMRQSLARWTQLPQRAATLLDRLRATQQQHAEFVTAHRGAVVALTNMDVKLTQLQHLSSDTPRERMRSMEG